MGSVTPFWHVSHRVRRKPSGRGFLWVSLPQTPGEIRGLWLPWNLFHRGSYEGEGNGPYSFSHPMGPLHRHLS